MIYVYGGAFDPVTKAHLEIIKNIQKHKAEDDHLMLLISNNDEKDYKLPYQARYDLLRTTLYSIYAAEEMPTLTEQCLRTYLYLKANLKDRLDEVNIVVGADEWKSLLAGKWVHSEELLKEFNFTVVKRDSEKVEDPTVPFKGYTVAKIKTDAGVSSSKIREIFYRNPETKYKEVQDSLHLTTFKLIKDMSYYHQNGEKYEAEMEAFLKDYAKKKEENHWGEPSVTTDILAYNGEDILLIRRLKPPYKNFWALPGGFFEKTDIDLQHGAARELEEETHIVVDPDSMEQIKAYGHNFDPRMKICDVAFSVRVHRKDMKLAIGDDDAAEAKWFNIHDLPALAFHHRTIIDDFLKPMGYLNG